MVDFHFIKDPNSLSIIQTILDLAGNNFNAPYDSDSQPGNASDRNSESLIQYSLPGGAVIQGTAEPSISQNMGTAINSMLSSLAPFISAYGLILPILGVIRGIIEIICALMNPWKVISAVIRLFVKWIPPFISLFPPFAGIIIILSTIKAVLAIVYMILTEVWPTIKLLMENLKALSAAFGIDGNEDQKDAGKEKLKRVLADLINRLGILNVLLPLMELIYSILGLVAGFPCAGGKKSDCSRGSLPRGGDENYPCDESDTTNTCPSVLRDPPSGKAIMIPSFFGDLVPLFAYKIIATTGSSNISKIKPFMQDFKSQLDSQLDEPVDEASPFGGDGKSAHFILEITDKRGVTLEAPIIGVKNNVITAVNPKLLSRIGAVSYKIVPNFPMLIARSVIGVGCHPDVENVMLQLQTRLGDTELSALDKNPEAVSLLSDVQQLKEFLDGSMSSLGDIINNIGEPDPDTGFGSEVAEMGVIQEDVTNRLIEFQGDLKNTMNAVIARSTDSVASELEVDKNIIPAGGGKNVAKIIITPRDFTGSALVKNIPDGVDVSVDIFSTFGTIANQSRNNATGEITAELSSAFPGISTITAKVNQDFISTFDGNIEVTKELSVQFVADSILPTRRRVSKVGNTGKSATGSDSSKEPGGK